jgi:two-component system, OmpR family, sensor kinase
MTIRHRLTLWYAGILGVILLVSSILIYLVLSYTLNSEVDKNLQLRASQIGGVIIAENDPLTIISTGQIHLPEMDVFTSPGTYLQIVSADGEVVMSSQSLGSQTLTALKEALAANLLGQSAINTVTVKGARLRVLSTPILVSGRLAGIILVAQSLRDVDATTSRVLLYLSASTLLAILLAIVAGMFLTRATMNPFDAVTLKAQQIVANTRDLSQRLPVANPSDELGRLTITINSMLEQLEQLFAAQQRMGADVSHELRTPLTTIRGNIDLIRRGAASSPQDLQEMLDIIDGELGRMSRLVANMMLLSQADAGMQLSMRPVELDTLLLDVYRQAQLLAPPEIKIHLRMQDVVQVQADSDRLKQLLLNLVSNALKYTPQGGEVTITLDRDDRWYKISVADTGEGITPEALPHIFERFYRAPGQKQQGTGLGLSIARWIALEHDGDITVRSEPEQGSTFTVWLPRQARPTEGAAG